LKSNRDIKHKYELKKLSKKKFEYLLIRAVDEGLGCLGDSVKCSVYFHLENSFGLRKEEIPEKPENFSRNLAALFKDGSNYIEKLILKKLYENAGLEFEYREDYSFTDYINEIKRFLIEKNVKERRKLKCEKG